MTRAMFAADVSPEKILRTLSKSNTDLEMGLTTAKDLIKLVVAAGPISFDQYCSYTES